MMRPNLLLIRLGISLSDIVNSTHSSQKGLRHISQGLRANLDYVERRRLNPSSVWGIQTGLIDFDDYTGGLHPSETTYIAGPPGCGKTKLGTQMICQAALRVNGGHPGAIYSFEMSEAQIIKRIVSQRQHISTFQMDSGKITDEVYQEYLTDIEYIESLPIYISDRPMTPQEFHADLARAKKEFGVEDFLLDYLLLMPGYENLEETERSGVLSRMIKHTVQELDVAGVTIATTNKEIFNVTDTPSMKMVRGSANVVFDADNITMLTPCSDAGKQNYVHWTFVKTRTIARSLNVATIELIADPTYPIFKNAVVQNIDLDRFG